MQPLYLIYYNQPENVDYALQWATFIDALHIVPYYIHAEFFGLY